MLRLGAILLVAISAGTAAQAQDRTKKKLEALITRPSVELESLIKVTGDRLDPSIEVSSHGATQLVSKGLIASTTIETSFLRAFIDKKSGKVTSQVYHITNYGGRGWKRYTRATFESPDGVKEVETNQVNADVDCSRYGCGYTEEIVFPIDFSVLETAAANYDPENPLTGIHYRLFAQSGEKIDEGIPINEIAAFVTVVRTAMKSAGY